jgi:uncharacterized membrane protein
MLAARPADPEWENRCAARHLQLLGFIGFSAAGALALWTMARARTIEALAAVTRSLALGALA